jgi:4-amino-4-deoxy-L-arabinose transferase-like glycosyltransferase
MRFRWNQDLAYFLLWAVALATALCLRPLIPVDETRATTVAWEMWVHGDWLVPHVNGEPYSHKPPLLQWLILSGWLLFGVNEWTARAVAPLFALASLYLTAWLGRQLWPGDLRVSRLAPWFLLGTIFWITWSTLTLYDMVLTFFVLLAWNGILLASRGWAGRGWLITGLALGGGILAKGPVVFLFVLPTALAAPLWLPVSAKPSWEAWYRGACGALALGAVVGLLWAVPAGLAGGEEYRQEIFWGQSAGRLARSFAHQRQLWWYFEWLPCLLLPWTLWPPLWRSMARTRPDAGIRFCLVPIIATLLLFSAISGKQVHYLLPMFPALSLVAARSLQAERFEPNRGDQGLIAGVLLVVGVVLSAAPWLRATLVLPDFGDEAMWVAKEAPLWVRISFFGIGFLLLEYRPANPERGVIAVALAMTAVFVATHWLFQRGSKLHYYDLRPMAEKLAEAESRAVPIAYWRPYHGEYHFLGRLKRNFTVLENREDLQRWVAGHPEGKVVIVVRGVDPIREWKPEFEQYYRAGRRVGLWSTRALLENPRAVDALAR